MHNFKCKVALSSLIVLMAGCQNDVENRIEKLESTHDKKEYTFTKSVQLAPGQSLTLQHEFAPDVITAQFQYLGGIYDVSDFTTVFLPNDPYSGVKYFDQVDPLTSESRQFQRSPIVWPEKDGFRTLVAYEESGNQYIKSFSFDAHGLSTSTSIDVGSDHNEVYAVKMSDTRFAVMVNANDKSLLSVYNTDGTLQAGPVIMKNQGFYSEGTPMAVDARGNIVTCTFKSSDPVQSNPDIVQLEVYDPTLSSEATVVQLADLSSHPAKVSVNSCALGMLPNNNLLAVHEGLTDDDSIGIITNTLDADKNIVNTNILSKTYSYNISLAVAGNGNALVVYELGGPDATGFVVLNQDGKLISEPDILTDNEPDEVLAAVFDDGSFAAIHFEDDSIAATMNLITNDGVMLSEQDFISPITPVGYGKPSALKASDNSFLFFYAPYESESPYQFIEVFKNRLTLTKTSKATSLENESHHTVDVKVTVARFSRL